MSPSLLETLHWLRPQALWLLLAVPLIVLLAWARSRQTRRWKDVVDAHLLPHLLVDGERRARGWPWAALLGWTLAVIALAGPSWRTEAQPLLQPSAPLVAVLDLSGRITATDLPPSRLLQARAKLATLLRERDGGQMALVVYAEDAYTVAPLTDDVANIGLYLDALSPQVMPAEGQRTDRAIDWATQLLQRAGMREGRILLLTDRADAGAITAAAQARAQGMQVSVLGLGTASGAAYRDGRGQIGNAALEEGSLRRLAKAGGGHYRTLSGDDSDLRALDVLRAVAGAAEQPRGETTQWRDEGFWLLIPLMLIALLAFRRHAALLGVVLVLAWAPLPPALAQGAAQAGARPAPTAPPGSLWLRRDQQLQRRIEQGVQAYRSGDFAAAAQHFEGIDTDEALYNLGNARARLGDLDGAVEAYDRALYAHPGMADAVANRAVVDAARKRRPPPGGKGPPPPSQGKSAQTPSPRSPPQQPGATGQPDASPPESPPRQPPPASSPAPGQDSQKGPAPPTPPDSAAQQQADAQQRQRMQEALQQTQAGKGSTAADAAGARAQAMTPQQREQQQAVEAWMRRVPDQPGDLLRAKFQLENQRRKQEGR